MNDTEISMCLPSLREGVIELRLREASREQLASGIAAARATFDESGVSPVRASICHAAVLAYEFDTSLPCPDSAVFLGAMAYEQACEAASRAAGAHGQYDLELHIDQGSGHEAELLWSTNPTIRAYRARYCLDAVELHPGL